MAAALWFELFVFLMLKRHLLKTFFENIFLLDLSRQRVELVSLKHLKNYLDIFLKHFGNFFCRHLAVKQWTRQIIFAVV